VASGVVPAGLGGQLGDSQYQCGGLASYRAAYDLSWGRYYSYDWLGWHFVVLNTTTPTTDGSTLDRVELRCH
jgi:hypothetical protein